MYLLHIKNKDFLSKRKLSLYLLGIDIEFLSNQISLIFVHVFFTHLTQLITIIILSYLSTLLNLSLETFHFIHVHLPFIQFFLFFFSLCISSGHGILF